MNYYEYIGGQVRKARKDKGWSLSDFRKNLLRQNPPLRLGITTLSEIERGLIRIDMEKLPLMAIILEKPMQFFIPPQWAPGKELEDHIAYLIQIIETAPNKKARIEITQHLSVIARMCISFIMENAGGFIDDGGG